MTYTSVVGNGSDAAAIVDAIERLAAPDEITLDESPRVVALPANQQLHSLKPFLDEYRRAPERIKGTAELITLPSFIDHVNRFKRPNTAVFASEAHLLAVYDYHLDQSTPEFCGHRASYAFPWSDEWLAWTKIDGAKLAQREFAEFVEAHVMDVTTPNDEDSKKHFADLGFTLATPPQMLAMSRGLLVRVDSTATAQNNLSTGEVVVSYKEEHTDEAGKPLKIPGGFMLLIPPFRDGTLYRIPVRLRYEVRGGKVLWSALMHRRELVVRDAIKDACEQVIDKAGVALYHGRPERT